MSTDNQIDNIVNTIFNYFVSLIPYSGIVFFLDFYVSLKACWENFEKQFSTSVKALKNSFDDTFIEFYKHNNQYIPILSSSNRTYNSEPTWIYNPTTKTFSLEEFCQHNTYPIPFIGASVSFKHNDTEESVGDMSDWIMDQTIRGPDGVLPLQVLVGAWRYVQQNTLMISYDNYFLSVITTDAEETKYNLKDETEIKDAR